MSNSDLMHAAAILLAAKNTVIWTPRLVSECVSTAMALEAEIAERSPRPATLNDVRAMRGAPPLDLVG